MSEVSQIESGEVVTPASKSQPPHRPTGVQRKEKYHAEKAPALSDVDNEPALTTIRHDLVSLPQGQSSSEEQDPGLMVIDLGNQDPSLAREPKHDALLDAEKEAETIERARVNRKALNREIQAITYEYGQILGALAFQLAEEKDEKIKKGKKGWRKEVEKPGQPVAFEDCLLKWHGEEKLDGKQVPVIDSFSVALRNENQEKYDSPLGELTLQLDEGKIVGLKLTDISEPEFWRTDLRKHSWRQLPGLEWEEGDFWDNVNQNIVSSFDPNKEISVDLHPDQQGMKFKEKGKWYVPLSNSEVDYEFDEVNNQFVGEDKLLSRPVTSIPTAQFISGVKQLMSLIPTKRI